MPHVDLSPISRPEQYRRKRRFIAMGFSSYEADAYARIDPSNARLRAMLSEWNWELKESAKSQGITVRAAARKLHKERQATYDELEPNQPIPEDMDPFFALGYQEDEKPHYAPRKPILA